MFAAICSPATSAGAAPSGWQSYCWLDFSTYNDATARSATGQNFSITLTDGSVFAFNVKVSSTAATGLSAVAAPSWTGAAIGNSSFLGIPNKPILYGINNASTVGIVFSNITLTPPTGAAAASAYMFVAADGESTNGGESLQFVTNGGNWILLDSVPPISGNVYPTITGVGTATVAETGAAGTVGGYIIGSQSPTTVTATLVNGGLQGAMFAVRFASITVNKTLVAGRVNAADQFTYSINSTTSGGILASGTTTGSGSGTFSPAGVSLASGLPTTVKEVMAAGSVSAMTAYSPSLTCVNGASGSSTTVPTAQAVTSFNFPSLAFGDAISCVFTNTAFPVLSLSKALSGTRVFAADQFIMNLTNTVTSTVVATTTTTGAGSAISTGITTPYKAAVGSPYRFTEQGSGATQLGDYTPAMACVNSFATSTTTLPSTVGGSVTPALGDNIICTITNTAKTTATLQIVKTSTVVSDPINGTINPKAIPGAVVQYNITVTNIGNGPVDAGTVIITDPLPTQIAMKVNGTPVTFVDGTPTSALSLVQTNVLYTKAAGGNSAYTYSPVPNGSGYDPAVTGIKVTMTGTMAAATSGSALPNFQLQFQSQVQ